MMRKSKWNKKIKEKMVIGLIMVIALVVGSVGGMAPSSQAFTDVSAQEAVGFEADSAVDATDTTMVISEGAEGTTEAGEDTEAESIAAGDEDQTIKGEDLQEEEISTLDAPSLTIGYNLFIGPDGVNGEPVTVVHSWTGIVDGIKFYALTYGHEFSIVLVGEDLTPNTNWSTAFNSNANTGNEQYFLHFYSTTNNKLTLSAGAVMGAHVRFHEGLVLETPKASNLGGYPLNSQVVSAVDLRGGYDANYISANGWKFIVDKRVDVIGSANLYAGRVGNSDFIYGKTNIDGVNTGYLEINSGRWRYIGASTAGVNGSYRIIIGNDDDSGNPVRVDAVFGHRNGTMTPNINNPDTPSEYIKVTGNTIVHFGIACMIDGSSSYSTSDNNGYTTQKIVVSGNASVLSTWGAVTKTSLDSGTDLQSGIRTSVTADAVGNGWGHYSGNDNKVNLIVEISDNAYIAGDVVGGGANTYFNVHEESKGIHISIKDYAQIGGNIVYGGSNAAQTVIPADSVNNPFFTMEVVGKAEPGDVKIGGHLLATNGEDNSISSSWNVATTVKNAVVNGSVFGYGNLANQSMETGLAIKQATITIDNSVIGGGVYGVAVGRSGGSCKTVSITITGSSVGHVAPIFRVCDSNGNTGTISNYPLGTSSVEINNSTITGRTVMWRTGGQSNEAYNLPGYSFVAVDGNSKTASLKALATIEGVGEGRTIVFSTDGYEGIQLGEGRPEISLTTSMNAQATGGMDLDNKSIGLGKTTEFPGEHNFTVKNTNFTRTNGNARVNIMDTGNGALGTRAVVTIDNCYATASDKKIDVAIIGTLTGTVTTSLIGSMQINLKNTNDLGKVGFAGSVSNGTVFINTDATIVMDNTVVDELFGKGGSTTGIRGNAFKSDDIRIQFEFKNHNTIANVYANGADVVFTEDSVSYISNKFNNTGTTVYDNEYVKTESGVRVYFGKTGSAADKDSLGGAKTERIFGSISGTAGELYIYKDTDNTNATYPIYVAPNGSILEEGMNLGEWTSDSGELETANKVKELNAATGQDVQFKITEPSTSKTDMSIQEEHDILIAFGKTDEAVVGKINDIPLRPWPLVKYSDVNQNTSGEAVGWLILGKPRYQLVYCGNGFLNEDLNTPVSGTIDEKEYVVKKDNAGTVDDYLYIFDEDNVAEAEYIIEDLVPTADEDTHYIFQYWMLYSTQEREEATASQPNILVPGDWELVTGIPNSNASDQNRWVENDRFSLKALLKNGTIAKENSKVLTMVPVYEPNYTCKIGNKGYFDLKDAFDAIDNETATARSDGSYVIEMLVETYVIKELNTITADKDITITTAGVDDETLPYKGGAGKNATLLRCAGEEEGNGYLGYFFKDFGTLTLKDIILDGNCDRDVISEAAFIQVGEDGESSGGAPGVVKLFEGSELKNNICKGGDDATASAIHCKQEDSVIHLKGTEIKNNIVVRPFDENIHTGATVSGVVTLEGKVIVEDNFQVENVDDERVTGCDICLDKGLDPADDGYAAAVKIKGSLLEGSHVGIRVDIDNHVDLFEFALTDSEEHAINSLEYFFDDYDEPLDIVISTIDPRNIMFNETVPFSFIKVRAEDTSEILMGVEFKLYELICVNEEHDHTDRTSLVTEEDISAGCWELVVTQISDENGLVDFGNLHAGTYMLDEVKTLTGYQLPTGQWRLTVAFSDTTYPIQIESHGATNDQPPAFMIDDEMSFKLPNIKNLTLPLSGMSGMQMFQILGALLATLSILLYIHRKRRNEKYRQNKVVERE